MKCSNCGAPNQRRQCRYCSWSPNNSEPPDTSQAERRLLPANLDPTLIMRRGWR